jgi:hypothetical protein
MTIYVLLGAFGGAVIAWGSAYFLAIKPLIDDIRLMRYKGYQPNFPKEARKEPEKQNVHFSVED